VIVGLMTDERTTSTATKNVFELWEEKDTTVKEAKKAKSKNWVVYAKSPEEKAKWISSIEKYKKKLEAENEPASPDDNGNGTTIARTAHNTQRAPPTRASWTELLISGTSGKTMDTSKSLKMPRSKSSRQLQRGTLKIISLDAKQDKSASLGSGMSSSDFPPWNRPSPALLTRVEPRRGTVGDIAQHSKVKSNREVVRPPTPPTTTALTDDCLLITMSWSGRRKRVNSACRLEGEG
jgi:hypothetical protein